MPNFLAICFASSTSVFELVLYGIIMPNGLAATASDGNDVTGGFSVNEGESKTITLGIDSSLITADDIGYYSGEMKIESNDPTAADAEFIIARVSGSITQSPTSTFIS